MNSAAREIIQRRKQLMLELMNLEEELLKLTSEAAATAKKANRYARSGYLKKTKS